MQAQNANQDISDYEHESDRQADGVSQIPNGLQHTEQSKGSPYYIYNVAEVKELVYKNTKYRQNKQPDKYLIKISVKILKQQLKTIADIFKECAFLSCVANYERFQGLAICASVRMLSCIFLIFSVSVWCLPNAIDTLLAISLKNVTAMRAVVIPSNENGLVFVSVTNRFESFMSLSLDPVWLSKDRIAIELRAIAKMFVELLRILR